MATFRRQMAWSILNIPNIPAVHFVLAPNIFSAFMAGHILSCRARIGIFRHRSMSADRSAFSRWSRTQQKVLRSVFVALIERRGWSFLPQTGVFIGLQWWSALSTAIQLSGFRLSDSTVSAPTCGYQSVFTCVIFCLVWWLCAYPKSQTQGGKWKRKKMGWPWMRPIEMDFASQRISRCVNFGKVSCKHVESFRESRVASHPLYPLLFLERTPEDFWFTTITIA